MNRKSYDFNNYVYSLSFYIRDNGCHMAYEGFPHICIGGTITWGERVSGMWVPPHVIVPRGANMRETLICHMICIFLLFLSIWKDECFFFSYPFLYPFPVPSCLFFSS